MSIKSDNIVDGTRKREPTPKGKEYNIEMLTSKLKSQFRQWECDLKKALTDLQNEDLGSADYIIIRQNLDLLHDEVKQTLTLYVDLDPADTSFQDVYNRVHEEHFNVSKSFTQKLEQLRPKTVSKKGSTHAGRSMTSLQSAKVKAATAELKLKYLEQDAQVQAQQLRTQLLMNKLKTERELEESKILISVLTEDDHQVHANSPLEIVKTELSANADVYVPPQSVNISVSASNPVVSTSTHCINNASTYCTQAINHAIVSNIPVTSQSLQSNINPCTSAEVTFNNPVMYNEPLTIGGTMNTTSSSMLYNNLTASTGHLMHHSVPVLGNIDTSTQHDLTPTTANSRPLTHVPYGSHITSQISRLPLPEPGIFSGKPLEYPMWYNAFNSLIVQSGILPLERLYYLKRYLSGAALTSVQGYFLFNNAQAYDDAMKLLNDRYGDQFVIGAAFRDKLDAWPSIDINNGISLRNFSDFLQQCSSAQRLYSNLNIWNDEREIVKIVAKLPDPLVRRWARFVRDCKLKYRRFPQFFELVKLVSEEAELACDPLTSMESINLVRKSFPSHGHRSNNSGSSTYVHSTTVKNYEPTCRLCKDKHQLDDCKQFNSKSYAEKQLFMRDWRLCYGCLKGGHVSKECRRKLNCKICKSLHPTSLHRSSLPSQSNNYVRAMNTCTDSQPEETMDDEKIDDNNNHEPDSDSTPVVSHLCSSKSINKCSMILPVYISSAHNPNEELLVYALLDTQSDASFISEKTTHKLGLNGTNVTLSLSTLSDSASIIQSKKISDTVIRGFKNSECIKLGALYSRPSIPVNKSHIPTPCKASEWSHLKCIENELMPYKNIEIGLLVGFDNSQVLMPLDVIPSNCAEAPYGQKTRVGWGLVGLMGDTSENDAFDINQHIVSHKVNCTIDDIKYDHHTSLVFKSSVKEVLSPQTIIDILHSDFRHDTESAEFSVEDQLFLNIVKDNIKCEDKRYILPLPFKNNTPPILPNNCALAYHRLMSLKKRLLQDEKYRDDYCKFMDKLFLSNHAEIIENVNSSDMAQAEVQRWYLPHHGVSNASKPKLRVVFDASCKFKGTSLNEHLLAGPDMTNSLLGVLLRFRKERIAISCDVQQMFFQFQVEKRYTDYFRFLWFKDNNFDNPPSHYRMLVHIFGATSSPSIANYGLKQIAKDFSHKHGTDASDFVCNQFYLDDGLCSLETEEQAISLLKQTKSLCREGSLNLHKFVSNSKSVLSKFSEAEHVTSQEVPGSVEKALGIHWNTEDDFFYFNVKVESKPLTRRTLLSIVCSIYDPLGLISPFVLEGKKLLQTLCKSQYDWDDPISGELLHDYSSWMSTLLSLNSIQIPRCYKPKGFGSVITAELHCFSDASLLGYGVAMYLRLIDDQGRIHCTLVLSKSRVAPIKSITIPRLELVGALVSLRLSLILLKSLHYDNIVPYYWTDSKIVLGYISNDSKRFHTFVANRIQEIRDNSSVTDWHYVKSTNNPADLASRGLNNKCAATNKLCFEGPQFLYKPLCLESISHPVPENDPETKSVTVLSLTTTSIMNLDRFDQFSDFRVAARAISTCIRLKDKLLKKQPHANTGIATRSKSKHDPSYTTSNTTQLESGERELIRLVQQHYFQDELKVLSTFNNNKESRSVVRHKKCVMKSTSPLYRLNPFLDENNMIRVGGRIVNSDLLYEVKHPLVIPNPKSCHISYLLIKRSHEQIAHQGRGMTLNNIRNSGYHILGCVAAVSKIIYHCVTCRRHYKPPMTQFMSDLPSDRVMSSPPFSYSGVDLFGPWYIKEGRKELKRYGVVYTCLASRAVHIESVNSLSTDSFINSMRRFISIRGKVIELRSDRGTNIVGASNELKAAYKYMNFECIKQQMLKLNCDFVSFNMHVPSASHFGRIWERQIRSIRRIMTALLSQYNCQLSDECLRTFLYETAAIINSRPLTVECLSDPNSVTPLTPNHLLTAKSELILPPPGNFVSANMYCRNRWKRVQYLANQFWIRWRSEYLLNLQSRQKWSKPTRNTKIDDIVLIKDDNLPRGQWLIGKVVKLYTSQDHMIRSVKLLIGTSQLTEVGKRQSPVKYLDRPIHKLVLLLEAES